MRGFFVGLGGGSPLRSSWPGLTRPSIPPPRLLCRLMEGRATRHVLAALTWEAGLSGESDRGSPEIRRNILVGVTCVDLISATIARNARGEGSYRDVDSVALLNGEEFYIVGSRTSDFIDTRASGSRLHAVLKSELRPHQPSTFDNSKDNHKENWRGNCELYRSGSVNVAAESVRRHCTLTVASAANVSPFAISG